MSDKDTEQKNKIRDTILSSLREIRNLRNNTPDKKNYNTLLDTNAKKNNATCEDDAYTIRYVAPIQRTITQHLVLVHKARNLMSEYLSMKDFILDIYVTQIANKIGLTDIMSQQKMRVDIKNEMEENFKNLTHLSARLANEKGSSLDKDLAHNELKALTEDLSYRLNAYQPYYQSYLADNLQNSEILYEV